MSPQRKQKLLVTGGLTTLLGVMGMQQYVVRDLVAAFIIFCILFGALGITILVSFLLGEGIVRCFEGLVAVTASFRLLQPARSVVGPVSHRFGKSSTPVPIRLNTRPAPRIQQPIPFLPARTS